MIKSILSILALCALLVTITVTANANSIELESEEQQTQQQAPQAPDDNCLTPDGFGTLLKSQKGGTLYMSLIDREAIGGFKEYLKNHDMAHPHADDLSRVDFWTIETVSDAYYVILYGTTNASDCAYFTSWETPELVHDILEFINRIDKP